MTNTPGRKPPPSGKPVSASQSELTDMILPNDANPLGNALGGAIMHLVDLAAAIAAHRHSGLPVVTASMDHMDFLCPIHVGDIVVLKSSVNRVFRSSMEVGVKVFREESVTNRRQHCSSAYLTFVSIDSSGRPQICPPVVPDTREEKRRYREAGTRRQQRIQHVNKRSVK
jgi:acyl-CoA hydrolase